jgi:3-oxoacyl-(acyl-carrier-protein) synthase
VSAPIVITGIGAVSAYGFGWERMRAGIARGECALSTVEGDSLLGGMTLGHARGIDAFRAEFPELSAPLPLRETQMILLAAREALRAAGLDRDCPRDDVGVFLDRHWGPEHAVKRLLEPYLVGGPQKTSPIVFSQTVANAPGGAVARLLGVRGVNLTTMSGGAFFLATQALLAGEARAILVGGFESIQSDYVLSEAALGRIAPHASLGSHTPYDAASAGSTLGEGAVVLVLEARDVTRERTAILGTAMRFDVDEGWSAATLADCAEEAIAEAGITARAIDAVVGAADGVRAHDEAEIGALARIGLAHLVPRSLKGFLGDTRGMAAAASIAWASSEATRATLVLDATLDGGVFATVIGRAS